jgi:hypothetical protein
MGSQLDPLPLSRVGSQERASKFQFPQLDFVRPSSGFHPVTWECVSWTSRDHPQVDGLAERMVQTCKNGLRKICLIKNKEDWDMAFPYIAMGYRMSKHASLPHFSPYFLLFGKHPIPPLSIVVQMD